MCSEVEGLEGDMKAGDGFLFFFWMCLKASLLLLVSPALTTQL